MRPRWQRGQRRQTIDQIAFQKPRIRRLFYPLRAALVDPLNQVAFVSSNPPWAISNQNEIETKRVDMDEFVVDAAPALRLRLSS
jgi:hypothetical protein